MIPICLFIPVWHYYSDRKENEPRCRTWFIEFLRIPAGDVTSDLVHVQEGRGPSSLELIVSVGTFVNSFLLGSIIFHRILQAVFFKYFIMKLRIPSFFFDYKILYFMTKLVLVFSSKIQLQQKKQQNWKFFKNVVIQTNFIKFNTY